MKILKISGRNLASLEQFEVDFETEPLRSTGLFAITGPTGAGKSTLLDALCLALYDQTPRLGGGAGPAILDPSGNPVKSTDVLSLIRRGAIDAFVEVVFVGIDRVKYKAVWEVHRARKKASGSLQPQQLRLVRLSDGQLLGGQKRETLADIEARLGLSFEQFSRAVILPQGEFAAFLRAPEKDRAELLERMTGTELYSQISSQAHAEAAWWKRKTSEAEQDVQRIQALEPSQRREKEQTLQQLRDTAGSLALDLTRAQNAVTWHATHARQQLEEQKASLELDKTEQALQQAAPEAQELQAIEAAQSARSAWDAENDARRRVDAAHQNLTAASARLDLATQAAQRAAQTLDACRQDHQTALQQQEALKPELALARSLDIELKHTQDQLHEKTRATQTHLQEVALATSALQRLRQAHLTTQQALAREQAWQAEHASDALLEDAWVEWKPALQGWREAENALTRLQQDLPRLEQTRQSAQDSLTAAQQALTQQTTLAEEARQQLLLAQALRDEVDERALLQAQQHNETTRTQLQSLTELASRARDALTRLEDARSSATQAQTALQPLQEALTAAESDQQTARIRQEEATLARDRLRLSLSLTAHRSQLQDGQPCPLCGATSHPYADVTLENPLREAEARVQSLQHDIKQLEQRIQDLRTRRDQAETTRLLQTQQQEEWAASLEALRARWMQDPSALASFHLGEDPSTPAVKAQLEQLQQNARQEADQLRARAAHLDDLRKAVDRAQTVLNTRHDSLKRAEEALHGADKRTLAATQALKEWEGDGDRQLEARGRHRSALELLFQTFPALVLEVGEKPEALLRTLDARRLDWNAATKRVDTLTLTLKEEQAQLPGLEQQAATASARLSDSRASQQEAEETIQKLRIQRAALLDGRTVQEVEQRLDETLSQTRQAQELASTAHTQALSTLSAARSQQEALTDALNRERTAAEEATRQLEAHLQAQGVQAQGVQAQGVQAQGVQGQGVQAQGVQAQSDKPYMTRPRLEALLRVDAVTRQARKARLEALTQARNDAAAALGTLRSQREAHELSRPADDARQAQEALETLRGRQQQALQDTGRLEEQLRHDAQNRTQRALAEARLEQLRTDARSWLELDEVIGSKDGAKLRKLAQTLTLERLVAFANHHLRDLAPRYVLSRIGAAGPGGSPVSGLELMVIDRDMGEEARSVNTLSGGESFLVSLALALGLASLTSGATRIESLFIDEGFGSLDPETLEQALSVLDGLQATGRQVGVISHVPGLTERLAVQVRVEPQGQGRSRVRVEGR